ncbi:hypothetical protein [Gluconacetobacter takamatsuzukensis]|uniref:Uncharacterized protein n=1 Tax=Gluconacetobacter takamatsuzukensis TaxID=1286190 RepID=A0A7W4KAZ1_9PROT|nr:hypothetical protein [Gluconacetobacter takamatsuzukensis]MBB2203599.1 hypothetical protein [Gluconacetobacter takamatsuzukensis]
MDDHYRIDMRRVLNAAARRKLAYGTMMVAALSAHDCRGAAARNNAATAHMGEDGLRCPSGAVHIAEIQAIMRQNGVADPNLPVGEASVEVCATDATKFADVVTRGAPDDVDPAGTGAGGGPVGQKNGVDGTIQIRGRTAQMDANIYLPLTDADNTQCASRSDDGQQGGGPCKPHGFVTSFAGTWVFTPGTWATFQAGTGPSGNPIVLAVRIQNGPVQ